MQQMVTIITLNNLCKGVPPTGMHCFTSYNFSSLLRAQLWKVRWPRVLKIKTNECDSRSKLRPPLLEITTSSLGRSPLPVSPSSIALTTSIPSSTLPNTTCLKLATKPGLDLIHSVHRPSSHGVCTVVMKNWDPFVSGPALAILNL